MTVDVTSRLEQRLRDAEQDLAGEPGRVSGELDRIQLEATELAAWAIVGKATYLLARAATESAHYDEAEHLLDEAAAAYLAAGDSLSAARTTLGRMHVLDNLGRHADALALAKSVLADIATRDCEEVAGDQWRWLVAALHENMGIALGLRGDHRLATESYTIAASAFELIGAPLDQRRVRANHGFELVQIGRFHDAIGILAAVAEEFAADGDQWWYGVASGLLARAHLGMGATERAIEVADRSLATLQSLDATSEVLRVRLTVAAALLATGRSEVAGCQAISIALHAAKARQPREQGAAWMLIGLAFAERGRLKAAAKAYSRAVNLHDASGEIRYAARARLARAEVALDFDLAAIDLAWVRSRLDVVDAPLEHARVQLIDSRWTQGAAQRGSLEDALELCGDNAPIQLVASIETELGRLLWSEGERPRAEELLRSAVRRNSRATKLLDVERRWSVADARCVEAGDHLIRALVGQGDRASITEALRLSEATRFAVMSTTSAAQTTAFCDGAALSWRDAGDRVTGFASVDGEAVFAIELDRHEILLAQERLWSSIQQSIVASASEATAAGLRIALEAYDQAAGVSDLMSRLGVSSAEVVSISGHGAVSGVPANALDQLGTGAAIVERPSLTTQTHTNSQRRSTLIVDCGGEDLSWRQSEIDAVTSLGLPSQIAKGVASCSDLAKLVAQHDVIHFVGHATAGSVRTQASVNFEVWSLTEHDLLNLPLTGRLVIMNVCGSQAPRSGHDVGGLAACALAAGAEAVIGSHWPMVDSASPRIAGSLHQSLASGNSTLDAFTHLRSTAKAVHTHPLMWAGWSIRSLAPTPHLLKEFSVV